MAAKQRQNFYILNQHSFRVEDNKMFPKPETHPIIFEEVYKRVEEPNDKYELREQLKPNIRLIE